MKNKTEVKLQIRKEDKYLVLKVDKTGEITVSKGLV